jgi:hypothetical protein
MPNSGASMLRITSTRSLFLALKAPSCWQAAKVRAIAKKINNFFIVLFVKIKIYVN